MKRSSAVDFSEDLDHQCSRTLLDPLALCPMLPHRSGGLTSIKRNRIKEDKRSGERMKQKEKQTVCVPSLSGCLLSLLGEPLT